jgi:putative copper resistance protein D
VEPLATQIGIAAVQDVVFATAAGCLACAEMGKRSGMGAPAALRTWQTGLSIVLALTALAYLWLQAAVMSGSPLADAGAAVNSVLTQSHFGVAWSVGFVGALLATPSGLSGRWGLPLFIAGLVAWAAGKAAATHAADEGDFSVREAIHIVHLCATAIWAGSVIVAAIVLRRSATAQASIESRAAFRSELSYLATAALVVVLVTGFYNVLQDTGEADVRFFATPWGRILAAKLVCIATAVGLGGWNRLVVLPKLHAQALRDDSSFAATQKRSDVLLSVEALAMLVILVIAALLGHTPPTESL